MSRVAERRHRLRQVLVIVHSIIQHIAHGCGHVSISRGLVRIISTSHDRNRIDVARSKYRPTLCTRLDKPVHQVRASVQMAQNHFLGRAHLNDSHVRYRRRGPPALGRIDSARRRFRNATSILPSKCKCFLANIAQTIHTKINQFIAKLDRPKLLRSHNYTRSGTRLALSFRTRALPDPTDHRKARATIAKPTANNWKATSSATSSNGASGSDSAGLQSTARTHIVANTCPCIAFGPDQFRMYAGLVGSQLMHAASCTR